MKQQITFAIISTSVIKHIKNQCNNSRSFCEKMSKSDEEMSYSTQKAKLKTMRKQCKHKETLTHK